MDGKVFPENSHNLSWRATERCETEAVHKGGSDSEAAREDGRREDTRRKWKKKARFVAFPRASLKILAPRMLYQEAAYILKAYLVPNFGFYN